ncbi:family 2 glycosyl transferase [Calothrix sp. NIES-2100]|uniref:glycosyltransferase family 2 protein n=1 Tax=Calothrix sp. NIES-2100 TaxID=1954172 RepID=UPI000B5DFDE9|nr:family 2 glycosyl transferase [Calothrix sp. NIES-2100]
MKNQIYQVLEVICIDDCSTDRTIETIETYSYHHQDLSIHVLKTSENSGPSIARNLGWDIAQGDYIAFLDADDVWHPEKISIQYSLMLNNPDVSICGHSYRIFSTEECCFDSLDNDEVKLRIIKKNKVLFSNPFVTPSVLLKKNLTYRFHPRKYYCEDYLLWAQICLDNHFIYTIKLPLVYVFKARDCKSLSSNKIKMRMGDMSNYYELWKDKKISFMAMGFFIAYSACKLILLIFLPKIHYLFRQKVDS